MRAADGRTANTRRIIEFTAVTPLFSRGLYPDDLCAYPTSRIRVFRERESHKLAGKPSHRDSNLVGRINRRMDEKNRKQDRKNLIQLSLLMRYQFVGLMPPFKRINNVDHFPSLTKCLA